MAVLLIFGAIGGAARGLAGFIKYYTSYKEVKFSWKYFGMMVGISMAVGLGAVWGLEGSGLQIAEGVDINAPMALIIGYAGGDAIENLYKILLQKPILGPAATLKPKKK